MPLPYLVDPATDSKLATARAHARPVAYADAASRTRADAASGTNPVRGRSRRHYGGCRRSSQIWHVIVCHVNLRWNHYSRLNRQFWSSRSA